jgi:Uma2 family endonuclease
VALPLWEDNQGPWTEERWLALGETKQRVELFDGSILVSPAPTPEHQHLSLELAIALRPGAKRAGLQVYEAINLRLRPGRVLIPDLVLVRPIDRRQPIVDAASCALVCEIVSPSNPATDRVLKMHYYAEAGIASYLLVEPDPVLTLRLYRLENCRYVERALARPGEELKLTEPVHAVLDPATLVG